MSDQLPDATKLIAENARLRKLAEQNEQAADSLWAERDRLREALEKIAAMPLSASWQQHFYDAVRLAQDVLQEAGDE